MIEKKIITLTLLSILLIIGCYSTPNQENQNIEIKGSDTLLQLISNLAETYSKKDENTRISVTGGGSGTGIAALINGEIQIADSSRKIKEKEINIAKQRGITIYEIIIARDKLTIIVNKDNKIKNLSITELSEIFSGELTNWKELGGENQKISLYGRQSTSGTYLYFRDEIIKKDYSPNMRELEGNQAIIESVKQDKNGISYVGIAYVLNEEKKVIEDINVLSIGEKNPINPVSDNKNLEEYPLSRPLYQYLKRKPEQGTKLRNFLNFELSEEGQEIIQETGFNKITENDVLKNQN